jgi:hypothetical protein
MRAGARKFGFVEQSLVYKFAPAPSHFPWPRLQPRLSPVSDSNSQAIRYGQHSGRMIRNSRSSALLDFLPLGPSSHQDCQARIPCPHREVVRVSHLHFR